MRPVVVLYKAFRGGEWFSASLRSVADQADGIAVVFSTHAWLEGYDAMGNCSQVLATFSASSSCRCVWTGINSRTQEQQYAVGIDLIRREFGEKAKLVIIDTDEVWTAEGARDLFDTMRNEEADYYVAHLYDYVKSPFYRITPKAGPYVVGVGSLNPPLPVQGRFHGWGKCSHRVIQSRFHHFPLVRENEAEVRYKLQTTGSQDGGVTPDWFDRVWPQIPNVTDLHPHPEWPYVWPSIDRVTKQDLPETVQTCPRLRALIQKYQDTERRELEEGLDRTAFINRLMVLRGYQSYLEIGVNDPATGVRNFRQVCARRKLGVDPYVTDPDVVTTTSDEFFVRSQERWDVVFVDGDHRWMQVLRDAGNALDRLNPGGCVVLHDVLPQCEEHTQLRYGDGACPGNGTAWKAYALLRMSRPDLEGCLLNVTDGMAVLWRGKSAPLCIPEGNGVACPSLDGVDRDFDWGVYEEYVRPAAISPGQFWSDVYPRAFV